MEDPKSDRLVRDYLGELDRRLSSLPRARRRQIKDEVVAHIEEGSRQLAPGDEAGLRQLLEQLGDPEEIARDAGAGLQRRTWPEVLAPWLLLFGGLLFYVGWFAGVAILWGSPVWRLRDKVLGTLVIPFGIPGLLIFVSAAPGRSCASYGSSNGPTVTHCSGMPPALGAVILIALVVAPFLVAIHLDRVRRRA